MKPCDKINSSFSYCDSEGLELLIEMVHLSYLCSFSDRIMDIEVRKILPLFGF
jgi:hypothetical protein